MSGPDSLGGSRPAPSRRHYPTVVALVLLASLATIIVTATLALGYWGATPVNVDGTTALAALPPDRQVAVDGNNVYAVWTDNAVPSNVQFAYSTNGGATFTAATSPGAGSAPSVAASSGVVVVAWMRNANNADVRKWNPATANWAAARDTVSAAADRPMDASWTAVTANGNRVQVFIRRSNNTIGVSTNTVGGTNNNWSALATLAGLTAPAGYGRVALSGSNTFLVWQPTAGTASFARSGDSGASWTVTSLTPGTGTHSVYANGNNAYLLREITGSGLWVQQWNGTSWLTAMKVTASADDAKTISSAEVVGNGSRVNVMWQYATSNTIYAHQSTDGGASWTRPIKSATLPTSGTYVLSGAGSPTYDGVTYGTSAAGALNYLAWTVDVTPPTVPTNLTASGATSSTINVAWTASSDAGGSGVAYYEIYVDGSFVATTAVNSYLAGGFAPVTTHAFEITAVDQDGNVSAKTAPVNGTTLDQVPPVTTVSAVPASPDGTNGWYASDPLITLSANESGLTYYSYVSAAGPWSLYAGPVTVLDGEQTLYYYSVDTAANAETPKSLALSVDTVNPTVAVAGVTDGAYYAAAVTPTFSASDLHLASVTATLDGSTFSSGTSVSGEGSHTFSVRAVDLAGNSATTTVTFTIDATKPMISVSGVSDGAYYVSAVTPTFSATDAHLASVSATLDTAPFTSGTTVSSPGLHTLAIRATDLAGNESTTTLPFTIDTNAPVVTIGGITNGGRYTAPVTPTFSAADSDLKSVDATLDNTTPFASGTTVSAQGEHTLLVVASDNAGNQTSVTTTFAIDSIAPVLSLSGVSEGAYYKTPVTPVFSATDANLDSVTATLDATTPFLSGTAISSQGHHTLDVRADDTFGNATTQTVSFDIDTIDPVISVSGVTHNAVYDGPVTPTFSVADDNLVSYDAVLDSNAFASGTTVSLPGEHALVITAVDAAGNTATTNIVFKIDTTTPVITIAGVSEGTIYGAPVTPTFSATDDNLASLTATLDGAAFTSGTEVSAPGSHTLTVRAEDIAGHVATEAVTFAIDTVAPVITITGVEDGKTYGAPVTPIFSATDANLAGVSAVLDSNAFTSGTTVSIPGEHTLVVTATDAAGNTSTQTVTFTLVVNGPTTSWLYPASGGITVADAGPVTLRGSATDAGLGVSQVVLKISRTSDGQWWNGTTWSSSETSLAANGVSDWTYDWALDPAAQDGAEKYTLAAYSIDSLGLWGTTNTLTDIQIDNIGPTVVSAIALDATHVDVTFSESLAATGSLPAAFTIDNGINVTGATLSGSGKVVHLTTDAQSVGVTYTVTAVLGALSDLHNNPNIAPNTAQFQTGAEATLVVTQGADLGWPATEYFSTWNRNCVVDELVLSAYGGPSTVDTITVRGLDTADNLSSDVASVALYVDDGNGIYGTGDLPLGSEGTFSADASGTPVTFGGLGETVFPGSPASVWVVYRTSPSAADGHELGSRVEPSDVEVMTGGVGTVEAVTSSNAGKTVGIDSIAPSTITSGVADGWVTSDTTVTLVATDTFSGVAGTWYTVNGSLATSYTAPIAVSTEGTTSFTMWSQDRAGNLEAPVPFDVKIDRTAPATPARPTASALSTGSAQVSWPAAADAVSGVDHYEVLANHSVVATSASTSALVSTLATETIYDISVIAVDRAGNRSGESSTTSVFTLAASVRPSQMVYARSAGSQGVFVDWGESTGTVPPVSYRVWRSVGGGALSAVATIAAGEPRSYIDGAAPRFANLAYAVSVIDARGEGDPSVVTTLSSTESTRLPAPAKISVKNTHSVLVTWTPVTDPAVVGYNVYRTTTSTGTASPLNSSPIAEASYHDTSTADYTEYWYRVATVDNGGHVGVLSSPRYIRTASKASTETPHGGYTEDTDFCALCHATHSATGPLLLQGTSNIDAPLCLSCHDGTSASDVLAEYGDSSKTSRHSVPVMGYDGTLQCSSCHAVHSADQSTTVPGLLAIKGVNTGGNEYCYGCHGESAGSVPRGDMSMFEGSAHATAVAEPPTGTKVVCLSCHVAHSSREDALYPYANDDRCLGCHSTGTLSGGGFDVAERLSGDDSTTRHDVLSADMAANGSRLTCANCHEPHTASATTPTVDPDNPGTNGGMQPGVAFCLRCHDGTLPRSDQTTGWASAPLAAGGSTTTTDIASAWTTNVHGEATGTPAAVHLRPEMGYSAEDTMTCAACHDSHGSPNRFMLLDTVRSKSGTDSVSGLLVAPLPNGGADMRFFCSSCHELTPETHPGAASGGADLSVWPLDCTACHKHVGNGL